jgi:hypothetical protein
LLRRGEPLPSTAWQREMLAVDNEVARVIAQAGKKLAHLLME